MLSGAVAASRTRTPFNPPAGPVNANDAEPAEITTWDSGLNGRVMGLIWPLIKGWHAPRCAVST
jgi:hypothetical protein